MRSARILVGLFAALSLYPNLIQAYAHPSDVQVSSDQIVLVPAPVVRVCDVIEQISLTNPSSKAEDITLPIPVTSTDVTVNGSKAAISVVQGASGVNIPIAKTAVSNITLAFQVPFSSAAGVDIPFTFPSAVGLVKLYLPVTGFSLSAPGLKAATQTVTMSGSRFRVYSRVAILPGETLPVSIQGLPSLTTVFQLHGVQRLGQNPSGLANELGALGNIGIIVFVLLLCFLGMESQSRNPLVFRRGNRQVSSTSIESLYNAWTELEMKYRDGLLDVDTYTRHRESIRNRIVGLKTDKSNSTDAGGSSV